MKKHLVKLFSALLTAALVFSFAFYPQFNLKAAPSDSALTINTYDDEVVCYGPNASGISSYIFENEAEKENGYSWNNYHERVISRNVLIEDGAGIDGSRGGRVASVTAAGANWPGYVKIYRSENISTSFWNPNFGMFDPEVNTAYKISLSYRLERALTQDITFTLKAGPRENASDVKTTTDDIDELFTIPAGTAATGGEWVTVSGYVYMPAEDYTDLYIVLSSPSEYADPGLYLDNITVDSASVLNAKNIFTELYYAEGDCYEDFSVSALGLKFGGWYFDEACTEPAVGAVAADKAVWAKWLPADTVDFETITAEDALDLRSISSYDQDNKTLRIDEYGQGAYTNTWPRQFGLLNPDGGENRTIPGHTYKVTFSVKDIWGVSGGDRYAMYIANYKGEVATFKNGIYSDTAGNEAFLRLADFSADTGWVDVEWVFTESSGSAHPVVFVLHATQAGFEIDDISIVDITVTGETVSEVENDVNRDGRLDIRDLVRIKKMTAGTANINLFADIYKEENAVKIDANDMAALELLLLGA